MNKPAPKEPSMDEILSSIRQIIADDDAAPPRRPIPFEAVAASAADSDTTASFGSVESSPLALSAEQIVSANEDGPVALDFSAFVSEAAGPEAGRQSELPADFIDPEDISFESEPEDEPEATPEPPRQLAPRPMMASRPVPPLAMPDVPQRPRPSPAQAAPMPDPSLSADIAEELLEPATNAAVRANFARLNNLGLGNSGLTIESMMREMLRPMLKEWLDEHLPAVVERVVEKEISRISRGVE